MTNKDLQQEKIQALIQHFKYEGDAVTDKDITEENADTFRLLGNSAEYLVLTDDEANQYASDDISETVWAFNANFIIEHSSALDYDEASKKVIEAIAEQCESGNEAMKKLIDNFDEFVEDAISADGRGHFINSYDRNEYEYKVNGNYYYVYRIN